LGIVRKHVLVALAIAGAIMAAAAPTQAQPSPPAWLGKASTELVYAFGTENVPVRITTLWYPRRFALVFEFDHTVSCSACSHKANVSQARGQVIRFTFNRRTHRRTATMICEGAMLPPKVACLRH
jgi:hypothetical protein